MADLGKPVTLPFTLAPAFHGFVFTPWLWVRLILLVIGGATFISEKGASGGNVLLLIAGELAAILLFFPGISIYFWRLRSRATVELFEGGLRARFRNGREVEMAFDEVTSVAASFYTLARNGVHWGESGKVTLAADSQSGKPAFVLDGDFKGELPDSHPFLTLYAKCREAAKRRIEGILGGGRSVMGKGWELTHQAFSVGGKTHSFAELSAAEMEEGQIRVWRRGSDEPTARVDAGSPNAFVLLSILKDRIAAAGAPAEDPSSLGRVILKRWWFGLDGVVLTFAGVFVMLIGWLSAADPAASSAAKAFWAAATAVWAYFLYRLFTRRFYIHQRGARTHGLLGMTVLRDKDVDALTFAATRHYVNGAYQGTIYDIRLVGNQAAGKRTIRYRATLSAFENELADFRQRIAARLAERILQAVGSGGEQPWCVHDVITPAGVRLRPKKLIGYSAEIVVPYTDIGEMKFAEGSCYVHRRSKPEECITYVDQNSPNFWPGYYAVRALADHADNR